MAKIKVQNTDVEAIKEFTDREDPQEAFERKFRVLSENWREEYYVLCYYGIGGVGKTSFLDKLCRVIRGVEGNETRLLDKIDCNYIRYDFDAKSSGTDKLTILLSLRRQLGEVEKNFKFFRFDSAVLLYAKKNGISIEKDEKAQSLLENNPWLDAVVSTVGTVPVVGWVSGVIQAIDKSAKTTREAIRKHMDESRYKYHLNEIDGMELPDLLKNLHRYFIEDMKYNMQQVATKPLVVFLDTYEKYIDTVNNKRKMLIEDYWLRKGSNSVIQSIPGVLWVIAGREKLYWEEDDTNWGKLTVESPLSQMSEEEKEALARTDLEQHRLGDLSLKDATKFLQKAGVYDEVLCEQLHELTKGTPLFLDMCVDTYRELCNKGVQPEIDLFGKDKKQLSNRYLLNLSDANREMAYFLACLGTWNDESVRRISGEATTLRWYTSAKYEEFVDHSFIIKNPDGSYYMHETVRSAALENADKEILEEVGRIKLFLEKEKVEMETTLDSNATFAEYIKALTEGNCSYEEFYQNLKLAQDRFRSLERTCSFDLWRSTAKELFLIATKDFPNTMAEHITRAEYGYVLCLMGAVKEALEIVSAMGGGVNTQNAQETEVAFIKSLVAHIYDMNGMYETGLELKEQALEIYRKVLGENARDTLNAMNNLAGSYYYKGVYQKAWEMYDQALAISKQTLGEEDLVTLACAENIALSYNMMGEHQRALELDKQILDIRRRTLGEEDLTTLKSMESLASSYYYVRDYKKARELYEQTLKIERRILGEDNPEILRLMDNLAGAYSCEQEYEKAIEMYQQALELKKRILGEEHPDTLISMDHLGTAYNNIGEYQKALELCEPVWELRKRSLGEEHLATLTSMSGVASIYSNIREYQKALKLLVQALEISKRTLGETNPYTLETMNRIGTCYWAQGDIEQAKKYYQISAEYGDENARKALEELNGSGKTILKYSDGNEYEGDIVGGIPQGYGVYRFSNGDYYEGDFVNGTYHGIGTFFFDNKVYYQGEYKNGVREGYGKMFFTDGSVYDGEWKSDFRNGHGKLIHKDGTITEGIWKDGEYCGVTDIKEQTTVSEKEKSEETNQSKQEIVSSTPLTPEEKEVAELRAQLAETNDPALRCKLAARHLEGRGIELNAIKAFELYREAAEQGSCAALFCQAILCLQGRGTRQDVHAAFDLFKKAAEQGHANAQFMMSLFYGTGRVVVKDEQMAARWYEKALQSGELKKAYDVNKLYLDCEDARNNLGMLVAWHEHTSYQEFAVSRCNFGYMYETGRGIEADKDKAREWYEKAAGQGDEVAENLLAGLKKPGLFGKLFGKSGKK